MLKLEQRVCKLPSHGGEEACLEREEPVLILMMAIPMAIVVQRGMLAHRRLGPWLQGQSSEISSYMKNR